MELPLSHIRAQPVKNWCQPFGIEADVLRLDELHPLVSGNKWFKLQPWLHRAASEGKRGLLTFGGAWSNHLLATAEAARVAGLEAVALVRGEAPGQPGPTLLDCAARGMQLRFLARSTYREGIVPEAIAAEFPERDYCYIPEGGYSSEGAAGAAAIARTCAWERYTHVLAAVGTGTTLAGLVAAANDKQQCIGIPVLKNHRELQAAVNALLPPGKQDHFTLLHGYHGGGYARHSPELLRFLNDWWATTGIPSDFVYTGKLFRAADDLCRSGYFAPGSRLLLVHSGGLQGNRSLPPGTLMF